MSIGTDDAIRMEEERKANQFEEYPCFYCDTIIKHKEEIKVHKRSCREIVIAPGDSYICDKCSENCKNEEEFNKHKTLNHAPWAPPGTKIFWCNLCIMNYGTQEGLRTHRRNWHLPHCGWI